MSDDQSSRGRLDRDRINLSQDSERRDWAKRLDPVIPLPAPSAVAAQ